MGKIGWRFPPLSGGMCQGHTNNDMEGFKGKKLIDNLAREICQNSLDAHLEDSGEPVKVVFELRFVNKEEHDVFTQYEKCLEGCRKFWGNDMDSRLSKFLNQAETTISEDRIPVLIAGDYNTKGLSGSRIRSDKPSSSSSWLSLTGSDGVSVKSSDNSAGSYGIGKNAPFACSSLSMVFYNTLDENNDSAFTGVARLATLLNEDNKPTQRVGKYQNNDDDNEEWLPIYESDKNSFRDCFKRTERGTDVIIVGFTEKSDWINKVTEAVIKSFFVAIIEGKLIVELKDGNEQIVIGASSISQLFADLPLINNRMSVDLQLYNAFINPDFKKSIKVFEDDDVEIYIKSDSSYGKNTKYFRATGMRVRAKRIYFSQPYAAVVIVRGSKLGALLRDTEPPQHNDWDYERIHSSNEEIGDKAKEAIDQIDRSVLEFLKEKYETVSENEVDAAGVGEYLPDKGDGTGGQSQGDDILRPIVKIGNVVTKGRNIGKAIQSGVKGEGAAMEGEVRNHSTNPNKLPPTPYPSKPVVCDPDNSGYYPGAKPGKGSKEISTSNLKGHRAFPISSSQGLYKIVINPDKDYEKLYIECNAKGEDGKTDLLKPESFIYNDKSINIDNGKAGPVSLSADTPATFFVCFSKKEKMKLSLRITEVTE